MAEEKTEAKPKTTTKTAAKKPAVKKVASTTTRARSKPVTSSISQQAVEKAAAPKQAASSNYGNARMALHLLITLIVGFFGGLIAVETSQDDSGSSSSQQIVLKESELVAEIAEEVSKSVVSIDVQSEGAGFFGRTVAQQSAGTGIILTSDGYVVTNKHVIPTNTTGLSLVASDGTTYDDVEVVGRDPFTDIAYLKINGVDDLTPAKIGDSSQMRVGDKVVAIGNALGEFSNTVTTGIISGLSRPIVAGDGFASDSLQNLFQTDASINPGNSGGPLVNTSGEVIGINTAVAGNAENIGFSIPVNDIQGGIASVTEDGKLVKPYLGVRYVSLNSEISEALNLPVDQGAYLDSSVEGGRAIVQDSPAQKAGLRDGDIITKVNEDIVDSTTSLATLAGRYKVGDTIDLTVIRGDDEITLQVTLEEVPETFTN